jgi:protein ImuB
MPLAEAAALVRRRAVVEEHEPAADLAALAQLAQACERFSPLVGWETVEPVAGAAPPVRNGTRSVPATCSQPSALFLDVTGIAVLFGGEESLLGAVEKDFAVRGYQVRLAIADTIGAAWALTFAERGMGQPCSPLAAALSSLPIHTLRVPPETVDLLAQLGVTTIGQLGELPRDSLASRFGEHLVLRLEQALGLAPEVIVAHRPPPAFEADWILEVPRDDWECLECLFQQLLQRVAAAMAQRQEGAVRLACRLDIAGAAPLTFEIGLYRPTAVPKHLWELVRMRLEQMPLPGPVGRVTVQVVQSARLAQRQFDLFGGAVEGTRDLELLVDRLSSRLGMEAVVRPKLHHDPQPERGYVYVPLAGVGPKSKVQGPKSKVQGPKFLRPLELFDPPVMLEVLSIVPDGPPICFRFRGQVYRVARQWGPERIETGWWRGPSVRRDYYRVQTEEGQRFWLFRRLEDGVWGMQGVFA